MRTEIAAMTASSSGSISEESFAISTATPTTPHAAFQTDSLDELSSPSVVSVRSQDGEMILSPGVGRCKFLLYLLDNRGCRFGRRGFLLHFSTKKFLKSEVLWTQG
jgi:hypothetical protein